MLDIKRIREDEKSVRKGIESRGEETGVIDEILALDRKGRTLLAEVESLKNRRNTVSKEIGALKKKGEEEYRALQDELQERIDRAEKKAEYGANMERMRLERKERTLSEQKEEFEKFRKTLEEQWKTDVENIRGQMEEQARLRSLDARGHQVEARSGCGARGARSAQVSPGAIRGRRRTRPHP